MTTPMNDNASLEIGHYVAALRRRWLFPVLGALVGLALAALYLLQGGQSVTATTSADIRVITSDPFNVQRPPSDLISPETEVQRATSAPVLEAAAADIGGGATATDVRADMAVSLVPDTTVMRISYTADETSAAETGADALAEAYLDYRAERVSDQIDTIVDQLDQRREDLRADLVRINTIINRAKDGSGQAVQAESDRQLVNIELNTLSTQINGFLGLDTRGGDILRSAATNPTTVSPSRGLVLGTGLVAGLLLGMVLAMVRQATDRRVRDSWDVQRAGGGDVLARLHRTKAGIPAAPEDIDELRVLRELLFGSIPAQRLVIVVADLTRGRSGSDVAANFAQVVAETRRPVELVMADAVPGLVDDTADALRLAPASSRPTERAFADAQGNGGVTLVAPRGGIATVLDDGGTVNGYTDRSATGLGEGSAVTVIAVPGDGAHASLLTAGRLADAVVLVVGSGATRRSAVSQAVKELSVVGARVYGSVLVHRGRHTSGSSH